MSTPATAPVAPGIRAFWEATYAAARELPDPCTRRDLAATIGRSERLLQVLNSQGRGPRVQHIVIGPPDGPPVSRAVYARADVLAWLDAQDQTATTFAS